MLLDGKGDETSSWQTNKWLLCWTNKRPKCVCKLQKTRSTEGWKRVKWPRSRRPKPGFPDKDYSGRREGGSCSVAGPGPGRGGPTRLGTGTLTRQPDSGAGGATAGICTRRVLRGAWCNKNKGTAIITITSVILHRSLSIRRSTAKRNSSINQSLSLSLSNDPGPALRISTAAKY